MKIVVKMHFATLQTVARAYVKYAKTFLTGAKMKISPKKASKRVLKFASMLQQTSAMKIHSVSYGIKKVCQKFEI